MLQRRAYLLHPILLSLYPVLFIYSHNVVRIKAWEIAAPLIAFLLLGFVIWLLARALLRDDDKAALVTSFSVLMSGSFQHLEGVLTIAAGRGTLDRSHVLFVWLFLYFGGLFVICHAGKWITGATKFTNVFAVLLLVMVAITPVREALFGGKVQATQILHSGDVKWVKNWTGTERALPDIYYIVLDGYGRGDALKKSYGFDNGTFINTLRSKGFVVLDRSTSNYADTRNSITSSLNMDYVQQHRYSIAYSKVPSLMRRLGYKYIFVPSGYHLTNSSPLADMTIRLRTSTESELSAVLLQSSVFGQFLQSSTTPTQLAIIKGVFESIRGARQWHEHITESIQAVGNIPQIEQPTFTFAHIVNPHPPYVFNRDGSLREQSTMAEIGDFSYYNWWTESELFTNQITHLNRLVQGLVSKLLSRPSTPPIIILQSDHGTLALLGKELNTDSPSADAIKERMSNFVAFYGPSIIRTRLYRSITPVNIFRVIFNQYFGAQYPLLPDNNFWSFGKSMQDVTDVAREQ
jgi:hypothetical protein